MVIAVPLVMPYAAISKSPCWADPLDTCSQCGTAVQFSSYSWTWLENLTGTQLENLNISESGLWSLLKQGYSTAAKLQQYLDIVVLCSDWTNHEMRLFPLTRCYRATSFSWTSDCWACTYVNICMWEANVVWQHFLCKGLATSARRGQTLI